MRADLVVHRIGREIDFTRPLHGSQMDSRLREHRAVAQGLKDSSDDLLGIQQRPQVYIPFATIDEANREDALLDNSNLLYTPGRCRLDRRDYFSGAIRFSGCIRSHSLQLSISSLLRDRFRGSASLMVALRVHNRR